MNATPFSPQWPKRVAKLAGCIVLAMGMVVLCGWGLGVVPLTSVLPGWVAMSPLTALGFVLAGSALCLLPGSREATPDEGKISGAREVRVALARGCAAIVFALGLLWLGAYATGRDLGLDNLWFGQMGATLAPATAESFALAGCALILASWRRYHNALQVFAILAGLAGWLGLARYLYGGEPLIPYTQMAVHTALSFLVLSLGILCVRPDGGMMALLTSDDAGGMMARRLLPPALIIPVVVGWLRLQGQRAGWYGTEAGLSLFALANVLLFGALVWAAAAVLHRADRERKLAEEARRESEAHYHALFDYAPDGIVIADPESIYLDANASACRMLGYTREELIGRHASDIVVQTEIQHISLALSAIKDKSIYRREWRFRRKDGSVFAADVIATKMPDGNLLGMIRDVTERKRAEVAAGLLAAIVEYSFDAIIGKDLHGIVTSWNAGAERMFGYSALEMIGQPIIQLIPPDRPDDEERILAQIRRGESVEHFETRRIRKDGRLIDVSVTVSPIKDFTGEIIGASKVAREITERKILEAEREKFVSLAENSVEFIGMCDLQGVPFFVNAAGLRLTGLDDLAQATRTPVTEFFFPEDQTFIGGEFLPRVQREGHGETEIRFRHFRTGNAIWMIYNVFTVRDAHGQPVAFATVSRDITERKRAEEALRDNEAQIHTMVNTIPQLAWMAHADGSIFWYNQRWFDFTGTTPAQMEGWGWQSVHDPDVLPEVLDRWRVAIASGQPFEMEFPLRGADGRFRMFLTRVQPFKDSQGRTVQWFGTNTDVDELKRMEESLRATQARLNSTLVAGAIGTWTWDIGTDRLAADEFTAGMFSIEAEAAAKGLPVAAYLQAVVEEDRPGVADALGRAIQSCGRYDIEYRVRQKDGAFLWLQARGRVEGDAEGKAARFHGAVMDITERKRAEEAVRVSESRYHTLFDTLIEGFCTIEMIFDADGNAVDYRFLEINPAFEKQTGLHGAQGRLMRDLAPNHEAHWFEIYGKVALTGEPVQFENEAKALGRHYDVCAYRIGGPESRKVAILFNDITARKKAAAEIVQLNAELEQRVITRTAELEAANKELEAFSYSVSHDLRAPLRAVDGFSQAVLDDFGTKLPADGHRQLQVIRESAQRMGALIDDLLAFSRLSRQALRKQAIDTGSLVRAILGELGSPWPGRQIEVRVGDLPESSGDPALLKQVWVNLLSNALKYTGKREKAVVEIGGMKTNGVETFFVRDNGTGFDMRYAGKLFGVFQRLHRLEDYEGTGVGLAIVQRIVQRHGGRVWAEAAVGCGATFYFTLNKETQT